MNTSRHFPVKFDGDLKSAECFWAEPPAYAEVAALKTWGRSVASARQIDAAELAHLAAVKWEATNEWGTPATSFGELAAMIRSDPMLEVSGLLMASAGWSKAGFLGVCLFHRTWANNVYLDFLAAHPETMKQESPIKGVGTGLLYQLCDVAIRLGAPLLWGETTASAVSYYREIFDLPELADRLMVSSAEQRSFCNRIREKWRLPKAP